MKRYLHLQLGSIEIAVHSQYAQAANDLRHLYADQGVREIGEDRLDRERVVVVEAVRSPNSSWLGPRYDITGDHGPAFRNLQPREVLPYLEWAINWQVIDGKPDYLQLHAATLSVAGKGVVLAASSGSGKSTLAAGLIARGWQYLSDEFALIRSETGCVEPFPKALCIKAGSFSLVESLGLPLWRRKHYVKAFKGLVGYVNPHHVGPNVVGIASPVNFVIFPRYTATPTPRLTPMSRAEATLELASQSFNRHQHRVQGIDVLAKLVREAQCLRMETGDLRASCDMLESRIAA
ncbi:MAG: hypothetical protein IT440_08675 [Phycisphaeraceae bacterium]|nr:hypothetical protein [Phycisphaeraceae bacterium]